MTNSELSRLSPAENLSGFYSLYAEFYAHYPRSYVAVPLSDRGYSPVDLVHDPPGREWDGAPWSENFVDITGD
eukprot:CAMPEP_0194287248 /NCGR_PEP_ID=MMETSP0169-20130528/34335_1 /TAXON_ID=218684 /ORGANISM="Corethron pennatum, Strain L29A3" /LENGTH=72 /DNA_ID=CAMNT_0039033891 /DNA_START=40 /DNA_END=255 /DNA_ORIENTATION=+